MTLLQSIGDEFKTDKGDSYHRFNGRSYLDMYEHYFAPIRHAVKCVFEIGVLRGESLHMWSDYFPDAKIWGLDINPNSNQFLGRNITVVTGSQNDPGMEKFIAPGRMLDIVIDDGSHVLEHMLNSFKFYWPRVAPNGWYCIEDVSLAYADVTFSKNEWPGQHHNEPSTNWKNDKTILEAFLSGLMQTLHAHRGEIFGIHVHAEQILIQKVR